MIGTLHAHVELGRTGLVAAAALSRYGNPNFLQGIYNVLRKFSSSRRKTIFVPFSFVYCSKRMLRTQPSVSAHHSQTSLTTSAWSLTQWWSMPGSWIVWNTCCSKRWRIWRCSTSAQCRWQKNWWSAPRRGSTLSSLPTAMDLSSQWSFVLFSARISIVSVLVLEIKWLFLVCMRKCESV